MSDEGGIKIICDNKKAFHNYFIEDRFEAGIVLWGTEVKSLRNGKANIRDGYGIFKSGELFLMNAHIGAYEQGNRENHDAMRTRKLLLHRSELGKLWGKSEIKGYNLIPIKMYFKNGIAKVEIALARSKKAHDKRASTREKEAKRDLERLKKKSR
jgi:SsrA-binding protein